MDAATARHIATAKRLIEAKGEPCVWAVPGAATTDPDKPWIVVPGAPTPYNVRIVMLPLSRQYAELARFLRGTEIVGGGLYGLMPAVAFEPGLDGIVTRKNGKKLAIVSIDPLAPAGDVILYTVEFKQ